MSFLSQKKKDFVIFVQELTLILRPALCCAMDQPCLCGTICPHYARFCSRCGQRLEGSPVMRREETPEHLSSQDPWWIVKRACIFLNCPLIKSDESSYYLCYCFYPHNLCTWPLSCVFPNVGRDRLWDTKTLNLQQPSRKPIPAYSSIWQGVDLVMNPMG